MKFCPECGTPCEGANFCPGCGKDLRASNQAKPQAASKKVEGREQSTPPVSQPTPPPTNTSNTYDIVKALAPFIVKLNEDGKTYTITGVKIWNIQSAHIPDCVTKIGKGAFADCRELQSVYISSGVQIIEAKAFMNCTYLSRVTLSEGVTEIHGKAFYYCPLLKEITIPHSVTQIGGNYIGLGKVFGHCHNLNKAKVPQHLIQQFQTQCDPTCTIIPY